MHGNTGAGTRETQKEKVKPSEMLSMDNTVMLLRVITTVAVGCGILDVTLIADSD